MTTRHLLWRALPAFAAFTLASVLVAAPVRAQDMSTDFDGDGVADDVDDCPEDEPGELVGADGCPLCPCEETVDGDPWPSKRAYVACVTKAARKAKLPRKARRQAVKRARQAACGDEDLTRCCIWPADDGPARCRVMDWERCDRLSETEDVDDLGPGSCTPTVCDE